MRKPHLSHNAAHSNDGAFRCSTGHQSLSDSLCHQERTLMENGLFSHAFRGFIRWLTKVSLNIYWYFIYSGYVCCLCSCICQPLDWPEWLCQTYPLPCWARSHPAWCLQHLHTPKVAGRNEPAGGSWDRKHWVGDGVCMLGVVFTWTTHLYACEKLLDAVFGRHVYHSHHVTLPSHVALQAPKGLVGRLLIHVSYDHRGTLRCKALAHSTSNPAASSWEEPELMKRVVENQQLQLVSSAHEFQWRHLSKTIIYVQMPVYLMFSQCE